MQNVNLYQPSLAPKRTWRSVLNIFVACCVVALMVLLATLGAHWQLKREQNALLQLQQQKMALQQVLPLTQQSKSRQRQRQQTTALSRLNLKELLSQADSREKRWAVALAGVLAVASQSATTFKQPGAVTRTVGGQSGRLRAISQQHRPGLWLTEMSLEAGKLKLQGKTSEAAELPQFVARLSADPAFDDLSLSTLALAPDELKPGLLQFVVASAESNQLSAAGQAQSERAISIAEAQQ